jgi:hypothetical protein
MAKSYYSTVIPRSADEVWKVIRPFDQYAWAGVTGNVAIEADKRADQIGAIRRISTGDKPIRQVLLAHSDLNRSYTYRFCDPPPFPVWNYTATIRVLPVVATSEAFVEWWATFDCAQEGYNRWVNYFEKDGFSKWLAALREYIDGDRDR